MKYIKQKDADDFVAERGPDATLQDFIWQCLEGRDNARERDIRRWTEKFNIATGNSLPLGGTTDNVLTTRVRATGQRFVLTCAQSNTKVHSGFLGALQTFCEANDAELLVSRFTYNKDTLSKGEKVGTKKKSDTQETWWDRTLDDYFTDEQMELADGLVWAGELNIIPTRADPLTGFENYARQSSLVVPHVKQYMRSIPTMKADPARFMYSTGCITQLNYIQKAAGQKAELHHVFGALYVEVDADGDWFVRQLNWSEKHQGFQDLTEVYTAKGVQCNKAALAIVHGDIHGLKVDPEVEQVVFGEAGMLDYLHPRHQFFHDIIDFMPRNHHNIKDPHFLHEMHVSDTSNVQDEFLFVGNRFNGWYSRDWLTSYMITSNHDQAITTWLRNTSAFSDPENVEFWLDMNKACIKAQREGRKPRPFAWALSDAITKTCKGCDHVPSFRIVDEDESVKIEGIEFGLHGHLGPNGARGAPKNLRTVGKVCSGHTHSAGIVDGVYTAGVLGKLDMGYNKGLSSWSHSSIVVYGTGKRTIVTIKNGKWKA